MLQCTVIPQLILGCTYKGTQFASGSRFSCLDTDGCNDCDCECRNGEVARNMCGRANCEPESRALLPASQPMGKDQGERQPMNYSP